MASKPKLVPTPRRARPAYAPSPQKRPSADHFQLEPIKAFYCFLFPALLAAFYAPILDCDETFNFWEPTHYLRHSFGLQTWEYSPEYAIRSWFYISLHAFISRLTTFLPYVTKVHEFYLLRVVLAVTTAACETRLFHVICRTFNPRVGLMFLLCMVFSPGMFHASVAYLPSSFAMCASMLGMAAFMDWRGGLKTAQGIMWFGIAGIVGWPFTVALAAPFLLEEAVLATVSKDALETAIWRVVDGVVRSLIVLALGLCVDVFFYHSPEVVPFNIVWYNIFSGTGKGPAIFGTEPWHFYVQNLLLNFNIWFVLAMMALPLISLQFFSGSSTASVQSRLRSLVFLSPFYLWLAVFTVQPHKEERFMYPAYPALALNAAVALHMVLVALGSTEPGTLAGKIPAKVKLALVTVAMLCSIDLGVFRTVGVVTAYSAPMQVHKALQDPTVGVSGEFVCYGKEWYRFPSSYFLPDGMRAKWVKSAFSGLLPGEFSEANIGFGIWPTSLIPPGMNDRNDEDPGKHIDVKHCNLLVDSYFPGSPVSELEPPYMLDTATWEEVACSRLLDTSRTNRLGRMLWLPELDIIPQPFRRKWGKYCLLRRRTK
ncbi:MAG: mannosyltransferase [Thelocarpon impressellum]|nr:MAG: mannosyltransferase [Thelocarpon impressellum]